MKGSLHTDELMREVTASATGLRTERRISHVFVMDVPGHAETLFITDAAINIFPDLDAKRDIVQNAIDLWTGIGLGTPRVAILSAVETVTTKIPSTIEAAALCKMAERGQITGGLLDGPLAFDNAIDPEAARIKGIAWPGRRPRPDPRRPRPRGRQHAGEEPDLPRPCRRRRHRARRARADRPDLARRQVRTRLASCAVAALYANARRRTAAGRRGLTMDAILVVNAGSSSLKFQIFAVADGGLERQVRGQIDGIGVRPRLRAADGDGTARRPQLRAGRGRRPARGHRRDPRLARARSRLELRAIGHRVVHGGPDFDRPVLIDAAILDRLAALRRRWRRCTSRTTSRRSASRWRSTRTCRRSPASTPPSTAATPRTPTATPCRARSTTRASAATASTA